MDGQPAITIRESGTRGELVVALYGTSLMVAGIASRLARQAHLRVLAIDGPTLASALGQVMADVLVVDLGTVPIENVLALLGGRPDLLLVGVEASGARLLVLSGAQAGTVGADDLVALIDRCRAAGASQNEDGASRRISPRGR